MKSLYIDGIFGVDLRKCVRITNAAEIAGLYETYLGAEGVDLWLDCRFLDKKYFTRLLKFFEEFAGSLFVLVTDPVPETVVSRFTDVKKMFKGDVGGSIAGVRLRSLPQYMKDKLSILFDLPE